MEPSRFVNRRQRARELERRMMQFSSIYNSAALLRDSWHGAPARRLNCAMCLAQALSLSFQEISADPEAVEAMLYALADALYCSPLGVPWEA
jgi:hypothetical protein